MLVKLRLSATILKDFLRKQHARRYEGCKIRLRLCSDLFARLDMKPTLVRDNDDSIAFGDVVALTFFCRKDDAAGGIDFEVVDLSIGWH